MSNFVSALVDNASCCFGSCTRRLALPRFTSCTCSIHEGCTSQASWFPHSRKRCNISPSPYSCASSFPPSRYRHHPYIFDQRPNLEFTALCLPRWITLLSHLISAIVPTRRTGRLSPSTMLPPHQGELPQESRSQATSTIALKEYKEGGLLHLTG